MRLTRGSQIPGRLRQCLAHCALVMSFFFTSSCAEVKRSIIGTAVDSPIAMASHPTLATTYVLNAVLGAEYDLGSLHSYSLSASTGPQLLASEEAPRLGTALAVAKSGAFLIAGFSGTIPELHVYKIDAQGIARRSELSTDRVRLSSGRIGTIQLTKLVNQQDWFVIVSFADRTFDAQVMMLRYSETSGFQKLLASPADFYTPSRESLLGAYTLAYGSPIVFENLGLLVAFPYGTLGYYGANPSAFDWLTGQVVLPNASSDLRTVSALLVDLNRLGSSNVSANLALGFVPIAFNKDGKTGNPNLERSAEDNATFAFRTGYQSALSIDASGSKCQPTAPLSALAAHTAVVALNNQTADLIALGGFDHVARQLRERLDKGESQPILGSVLSPQPISVTAESSEQDFKMLVPQIQLIQSGSLCTLAWLKVEQRRSSLGLERSWLQIATAEANMKQLEIESRITGLASFAVSGSKILTGSFGTNQVQQLDFDGSSIKEGEIR